MHPQRLPEINTQTPAPEATPAPKATMDVVIDTEKPSEEEPKEPAGEPSEEEPKEPAENTGVFAAAGEPLPVREDAETEAEEPVEETGGDDDFDDDAPKKKSGDEDDDFVDLTDFVNPTEKPEGDDGGNVPF